MYVQYVNDCHLTTVGCTVLYCFVVETIRGTSKNTTVSSCRSFRNDTKSKIFVPNVKGVVCRYCF